MDRKHSLPACLLLTLTLAGCETGVSEATAAEPDSGKADDNDNDDNEGDSEILFLDQGWDAQARDAVYWTSQGSKLLPYAWFMALQRPDGEPFAAAEHLGRLGFVIEEASDLNPDGLPVGFTREGDSLGISCAACHTSEMRIAGQTVRIDGGSMQGDFQRFQWMLLDALRTTRDNELLFTDFAAQVLGAPSSTDELREQLDGVIATMEQRLLPAGDAVEPGPGRVDGVGQATNETLCLAMHMPDNCDTFNPPTNPGFLWGLGELSWVQSNGSVHAALPRNVGEALGVFGPHDFGENGALQVELPLHALAELEEGFEQLEPPRWDDPALDGLVVELDRASVERGALIYGDLCSSCHASRSEGPFTEPNAFNVRFVEVPVTPMAEIGTDPGFVDAFVGDVARPSAAFVEARSEAYRERFGTTDPTIEVPAAALRGMIIGEVIANYIESMRIEPGSDDFAWLMSHRDSATRRSAEETYGYRAQPLEGVAFTGPFLHNGSVRTLAQLLAPSSQREKVFYVGGKEFDPVDVGFVTNPNEDDAFRFDTSLPGNRNTGHEGRAYGTDLSQDDKSDLLEYLRSL